ncbi:MAG: hypothetical protein M1825_006470 [Sarcosagium campestre]|nr:MAG: hypothetical protein M1825_006470 [Sarcosagium campestre]
MFGVTRSPPSHQDPRLPRGECRFILLSPDTPGQRCSCQGFWLHDVVPGSSCACGHQACYHEPGPRGDSVSRSDYEALLDRVEQLESELKGDRNNHHGNAYMRVKTLEDTLEKEHFDREEDIKGVYRSIQGVYHNLSLAQLLTSDRLTSQDDKIDEVLDKTSGFCDELSTVRTRLIELDDYTMGLEDRVASSADPEGITKFILNEPGATTPQATVSPMTEETSRERESLSRERTLPDDTSKRKASDAPASRPPPDTQGSPKDQSRASSPDAKDVRGTKRVRIEDSSPKASAEKNKDSSPKASAEEKRGDEKEAAGSKARSPPCAPAAAAAAAAEAATAAAVTGAQPVNAAPSQRPRSLSINVNIADAKQSPSPTQSSLQSANSPLPSPVGLKRTFSSSGSGGSLEVPSATPKRVKLRTSLPDPSPCRSLDTSPLTREVI